MHLNKQKINQSNRSLSLAVILGTTSEGKGGSEGGITLSGMTEYLDRGIMEKFSS